MIREDVFPTFYRLGHMVRSVWRFTRALLPGLALALVLSYVVVNVNAGKALENELAQIREHGEPLTLREAAPPTVPDADNAALVYLQAFQRLPRLQPSPIVPDPKNQQISSADDQVLRDFIAEHGQRPGKASIDKVRAVLSGTDEALALVRRAAAMPRCRFPVDWEAGAGALFPHLPKFMALARLMGAHAILASQDGRPVEAMADLHTVLGMSRHIGTETILISQLVQYVCLSIATNSLKRVLEIASPGESECQRLYQELAEVDLHGPFERSVQSERCLGLWAFDKAHTADPARLMSMLMGSGGDDPILFLSIRLRPLSNPLMKVDEVFYLSSMAQQVALARQTGTVPVDRQAETDAHLPLYAPMTRLILPALERIRERRDKSMTGLALAQYGLALSVYHERTGRFPASQAEVERTVGWSLPKDPFTGTGLVYQPRDTGYLLYSLGENGRDDHGQSADDHQHRTAAQASRDNRMQSEDAPARRTSPPDAPDDIAWWFGT